MAPFNAPTISGPTTSPGDSTPSPLQPSAPPTTVAAAIPATSLKRNHDELAPDSTPEIKRIKSELLDNANYQTPVARSFSPSTVSRFASTISAYVKATRATADAFMADGVIGLGLKHTSTPIAPSAMRLPSASRSNDRSRRFSPGRSEQQNAGIPSAVAISDIPAASTLVLDRFKRCNSYESGQYTPSVKSAGSTDHIVTPVTCEYTTASPLVPVEGIATLQQAAADMLRLLVKKNAPNRERQMQVALGTIRTCIDVDFVPLLDRWRATTEKPSIPVCRAGPSTQAPINVYTSRETLRKQLDGALSDVDKLRKDLKRREEECKRANDDASRLRRERDAADTKSKETTKKMNERATKEQGWLVQIKGLETNNARLRETLRAAGLESGLSRQKRDAAQSSQVSAGVQGRPNHSVIKEPLPKKTNAGATSSGSGVLHATVGPSLTEVRKTKGKEQSAPIAGSSAISPLTSAGKEEKVSGKMQVDRM